MQARTVTVAEAIGWFGCGWRIFLRNPGLWVVMGLIFLVIAVALSLVPVLGSLAFALLTPVLIGGLLYGAHEAQAGRDLDIAHLFQGLKDKQKVTPLMSLGGVSVAAAALAMLILFLLVGGAMMTVMGEGGSPRHAAGAGGAALVALLLVLTLQLVVAMALLYAVPLVMFRAVAVGAAMRSSFNACLRNWLALTVFGIFYLVVAILASLPLGLGWLVLLPVTAGMLYCSYRDLYGTG